MLTMEPPCARSAGNAARDAAKVPIVSISITVLNPFTLSSSADAWQATNSCLKHAFTISGSREPGRQEFHAFAILDLLINAQELPWLHSAWEAAPDTANV